MRPQKLLLFDKAGADEDLSALLVACPICGTLKGRWCGSVIVRPPSRSSWPEVRFVHSRRARYGANAHKARRGR